MKAKMLTGALLGAALASLASAPAHAQTRIQTYKLHTGDQAGRLRDERNPRGNRQEGTGAEQTALAYLPNAAGGPRILLVSQGSYTDIEANQPLARTQLLCASFSIDRNMGPVLQKMTYVTQNQGTDNRNANNPTLTSVLGGTAAVAEYGWQPNNDTQTYVKVLGPNCEQLTDQVRVMAETNDDCKANDEGQMATLADAPDATRLASGIECNGNGTDDGWMYVLNVTKAADGTVTAKREFKLDIEANVDIWRPDIAAVGADRVLITGAAGNTRPANRGARAYYINVAPDVPQNQRVVWRKYIAESQPNDRIYAMNPIIEAVPTTDGQNNQFVVAWVQANLKGRRGKEKGKTRVEAQMVSVDDTGLHTLSTPTFDVTSKADSSHPGLIATPWGPNGDPRVLLLQGSIVGSYTGTGRASVLKFDKSAQAVSMESEFVYADSEDTGWISNIYGPNPNTQGRNFLRAISFDNPNYGLAGAWASDVKTFVAIPNHERAMRTDGTPEDKLSWNLVFVPAVVPAADNPDPNPNPDPGTGSGSGSGSDTGSGSGSASDPGMSFGGCAATGSAADLGTVLFLGLALAGATRRRRGSK